MTRKCAICKETNYKNLSSFFSIPKDPETRKLWQDAIGLENYVVKDDTYVCSKHFYPTDIITHWFSGVPPNVITIKYKKFRLKPGAVPKINIEPYEIDPQFLECDNESDINRSFCTVLLKPFVKNEETFSIPRKDINGEKVNAMDFEDQDSEHSPENVLEYFPEQDPEETQANYISNADTKTPLEECKTLSSHISQELQKNNFCLNQKLLDDDVLCKTLYFENNEKEEQKVQNNSENKNQVTKLFKEEHSNDDQNMPFQEENTSFNSLNFNNETMLFEDFLEIYTEVNLPKGWFSFVISKGHGTTIVYSFTKINQTGIPVVEKQVFVKNNMILRCTVKDRIIDPLMHNLIKENRNLKVHTLLDVEELIVEFNKRHVCDGNTVKNLKNVEAFREGNNWRHASCSLIINNGLSKCSKCASLGKRKSVHNTYSIGKSRLFKTQNKIEILNDLLEEQIKSSKCEDRLPSLLPKTVRLLSEAVDLLKLPKIQKVMIKECFKLKNDEEENVEQFSRTWIFLCLLLYIESPEMYKYMLLNKYMNLPPLFTVKAYLKRVKMDREFYNIFQQSIEAFQPFNEELIAGKSK